MTTIVCCLLGKASVTRWGPTILDRIKWNSKPPSPQSKDEAAQKPKRAIFPSLIWGGGGFAVPFYSVQDCWSPPRHASLSKQTTDDRSHASWRAPCSRNARAYSQRVMRHSQLLSRVLRTVSSCMIDFRRIYNVANLTNV